MSKVLIIEDEEAIADLEKDYLELSDFQVNIEHTGDGGLTEALANDYDLIILDLMLPGIDGYQVCREIRKEATIQLGNKAGEIRDDAIRWSNDQKRKRRNLIRRSFLCRTVELA